MLQMLIVPMSAAVAMSATVCGLVARGRWRLSILFVVYIVSVILTDVLMMTWPKTFWTTEFWVLRQVVHDILKIGIGIEIGWKTFRFFPGAESAVRRAVLVILAMTTAGIVINPVPHPEGGPTGWATAHLARFHPPVLIGTIWLMAILLGFARWYRVPIHPFHGGVLVSLAAYMALFSGLLTVMGWYGLDAIRIAWGLVDPSAFVLMTLWWTYLAWRPDGNAAAAHDELLARLRMRPSML
jgi:hypothetical protein